MKHKFIKALRLYFLNRDNISRPRSDQRAIATVITTSTPITLARQQRQRMILHSLLSRLTRHLVYELLLAVIDDVAVNRRFLLLRHNHRVLVAHSVQILLLVRLVIRVIPSPYNTRLVMRPFGAQTKLKRRHEIVSKIQVLQQLQTISIVVCAHPHHNLSISAKNNRIVVLSHLIFLLLKSVMAASIFYHIANPCPLHKNTHLKCK